MTGTPFLGLVVKTRGPRNFAQPERALNPFGPGFMFWWVPRATKRRRWRRTRLPPPPPRTLLVLCKVAGSTGSKSPKMWRNVTVFAATAVNKLGVLKSATEMRQRVMVLLGKRQGKIGKIDYCEY